MLVHALKEAESVSAVLACILRRSCYGGLICLRVTQGQHDRPANDLQTGLHHRTTAALRLQCGTLPVPWKSQPPRAVRPGPAVQEAILVGGSPSS
jgi:hypothetical protein